MPDATAAPPRRPGADDDALRRIASTGDPLAEMYREMVGRAVRLHIHLGDVPQLRQHANALRVLVSTLERLSHSKDPDHSVLLQARNAVEACNRAMGGSKHKRHPERW